MSKLPLRFLGLLLLAVSVSFASCAAFVRSAKGPAAPVPAEHAQAPAGRQ